MQDRNYEGYHDPTASEAIRRADRQYKRHQNPTYLLGKTRRFQKEIADAGRYVHEQ